MGRRGASRRRYSDLDPASMSVYWRARRGRTQARYKPLAYINRPESPEPARFWRMQEVIRAAMGGQKVSLGRGNLIQIIGRRRRGKRGGDR